MGREARVRKARVADSGEAVHGAASTLREQALLSKRVAKLGLVVPHIEVPRDLLVQLTDHEK